MKSSNVGSISSMNWRWFSEKKAHGAARSPKRSKKSQTAQDPNRNSMKQPFEPLIVCIELERPPSSTPAFLQSTPLHPPWLPLPEENRPNSFAAAMVMLVSLVGVLDVFRKFVVLLLVWLMLACRF